MWHSGGEDSVGGAEHKIKAELRSRHFPPHLQAAELPIITIRMSFRHEDKNHHCIALSVLFIGEKMVVIHCSLNGQQSYYPFDLI